MSGSADPTPTDRLQWRAVEIGPGGIPPEQVRPSGPDAPGTPPLPHADVPDAWRNWMQAADAAVPSRGRLSNATVGKIVGGLVALALVVGLALWANASNPLKRGSTQIAVSDCLTSTGQRIGAVVACDNSAADFMVVGRYGDSSDPTDCSASPADVAVILSGPTVLCLDYVATVGDCIFAGSNATQVGKVNCDSTLPGVYRVDKVLRNNIDPADCPTGTTQTLVHLHNSEVICLGRT
jgi:hypothetical protein